MERDDYLSARTFKSQGNYAECFVPIKNMALNGDSVAASIIGVYYATGLGEIKGNIHSSND